MIADTMIPEAFAEDRNWTGVITTAGYLVAFAIGLA
jgi:ZIP family zinc transporter